MDAALIDTDVFSFLMKKDTRADAYRQHVKGKTLALSFITVGELHFWAEKRKWSAKNRQNLEERLKAVVIVPYDAELCRTFGRVKASLPKGVTVEPNDLWIDQWLHLSEQTQGLLLPHFLAPAMPGK